MLLTEGKSISEYKTKVTQKKKLEELANKLMGNLEKGFNQADYDLLLDVGKTLSDYSDLRPLKIKVDKVISKNEKYDKAISEGVLLGEASKSRMKSTMDEYEEVARELNELIEQPIRDTAFFKKLKVIEDKIVAKQHKMLGSSVSKEYIKLANRASNYHSF